MNNTAWHNQDICRHILATNFPPLKDSVHFPPLRKCVLRAVESTTVLDVGCCKAELAQTFPELDYTGADLEHIIVGVSKVSGTSRAAPSTNEWKKYMRDVSWNNGGLNNQNG